MKNEGRVVYRGFDQAALDAEYNLRAAVPEHGAYFARWAAASAAVRRGRPCRLDLAYGPKPAQRLDLFDGPRRPAPLLVFFHGGFWRAMDKSDFSFIAPAFQEAGAAVAVVNYTLAPAASITEMVAESRAALGWLREHAAALGIDLRRITLAGHSAGGHLAAMAMLEDAGARPPLWGLCAVSGVFDLEPIRLSFHNEVLGLAAAEADALSPTRRLAAGDGGVPGRLLLAVGGGETAEFQRQQAEFAAAWRRRCGPPTILAQPGEDHFSIMDRLADGESPLFAALAGLLGGSGP
ncbi:MAG TPA: alpha/beta hydrolase [Stellaceae bacterium]|nr:alpha/beta hydrolase [Stellaceae bacterium]